MQILQVQINQKIVLLYFVRVIRLRPGIVSGLNKDDRNTIGIYPMKGKLFNVRGEITLKIAENKEIAEIKQILGLETGKIYKRTC